MDENRADQSLRDELALAIERALAIDPDPALKVHVRARIDLERARHGWWQRWRLVSMAAGIAAVAVVAVLAVRRPAQPPVSMVATREASVPPPAALPPSPAVFPESPSTSAQPPAVVASRARARAVRLRPPAGRGRSAGAPAQPFEPQVLVPRDQAPVLHSLTASLRDGRLDPTALNGVRAAAGPLTPPGQITIQPIVITPLARLALLEGAHQ